MELLRNNVVEKHVYVRRSNTKCLIKILLKLSIISVFFYIFFLLMLHDQLHSGDQRKAEKKSLLFRSILDFGRDAFIRWGSRARDSTESYGLSNISHFSMLRNSIKIPDTLNNAAIPQISTRDRCPVRIPNINEIDYNNTYWQRFVTSNITYFLYSAYYDNRQLGGPLPMVRITAMINRLSPPLIFCQIWYVNASSPVVIQATYLHIWRPKWGNYRDGPLQPFLVTCRISHEDFKVRDTLVPRSVSLVENPCDNATNNLDIVNNRPLGEKKQFAVCVKGLDFPDTDLSARLVEWIELLNLLGVENIFFYQFNIHSNISKVLKYYHDRQLVQVQKISLPGSQPNLPKLRHSYLQKNIMSRRQNEVIPYNDCLYRNMYSYRYLVLLDIDEVIMPLVHHNWSQLIAEVLRISMGKEKRLYSAYSVRNTYFFDNLIDNNQTNYSTNDESNIPAYVHMLKHVYRSSTYSKPYQYMKSFFDTERVVSMHNHHPFSTFGERFIYVIHTRLGHLQHYRSDCVAALNKSCAEEYRRTTVRDTTIWRYKRELIQRTSHILTQLGLLIS